MNIFVLDYDQKKNAEYHCARHTSKMVSEYAQILSTVIYETTGHIIEVPKEQKEEFWKLYPKLKTDTIKPTHKRHPCVLWTMESYENFSWLMDMLDTLHDEWIHKFNHKPTDIHGSYYKFLSSFVEPQLPHIGMTPFKQCMPDQYKRNDPVEAYRAYYNGDKRHLFNWKNRQIPEWISK